MYPAATLAKPPAQSEAVKNQISDMTATVQGYNGKPVSPPTGGGAARPGAEPGLRPCIIQARHDEGLISAEYEDTESLFLSTNRPVLIHNRSQSVSKPGEFAGLLIRRPTAGCGQTAGRAGRSADGRAGAGIRLGPAAEDDRRRRSALGGGPGVPYQ